MDVLEEETILSGTGCDPLIIKDIIGLAQLYRSQVINDDVTKGRKLGTRTLLRIARHMARIPTDFLTDLFNKALHIAFLPALERTKVEDLYSQANLNRRPPTVSPASDVALKLIKLSFEIVLPCSQNSRRTPCFSVPHQFLPHIRF